MITSLSDFSHCRGRHTACQPVLSRSSVQLEIRLAIVATRSPSPTRIRTESQFPSFRVHSLQRPPCLGMPHNHVTVGFPFPSAAVPPARVATGTLPLTAALADSDHDGRGGLGLFCLNIFPWKCPSQLRWSFPVSLNPAGVSPFLSTFLPGRRASGQEAASS
jgi:hypothetical protein